MDVDAVSTAATVLLTAAGARFGAGFWDRSSALLRSSGAEAASTAWSAARRLAQRVHDRMATDGDETAASAVACLAAGDADAAVLVQARLTSLMVEDPAFAEAVANDLDEAKRGEILGHIEFRNEVGDHARVGKIVQVHKVAGDFFA